MLLDGVNKDAKESKEQEEELLIDKWSKN